MRKVWEGMADAVGLDFLVGVKPFFTVVLGYGVVASGVKKLLAVDSGQVVFEFCKKKLVVSGDGLVIKEFCAGYAVVVGSNVDAVVQGLQEGKE